MCEGSGKLTDDMFLLSEPAIQREIAEEIDDTGSSRTRDAIMSSKLKFIVCGACEGRGRVPS